MTTKRTRTMNQKRERELHAMLKNNADYRDWTGAQLRKKAKELRKLEELVNIALVSLPSDLFMRADDGNGGAHETR